MNVIFAIPTCNLVAAKAAAVKWKARGYEVAFLLNGEAFDHEVPEADYTIHAPLYPGWGRSINRLAALLKPDWLVTGGDDMLPDPTKTAQEIAKECTDHFGGTFGVMQPTGDPWGTDNSGVPAAARICGSPWLGREFCSRWNQGTGPIWEEYTHFFADEELKVTSERHNLLWQRPDLIHYHDHFMRRHEDSPLYWKAVQLKHDADMWRFWQREKAGFPGHQPM